MSSMGGGPVLLRAPPTLSLVCGVVLGARRFALATQAWPRERSRGWNARDKGAVCVLLMPALSRAF